MDAEAFRKQYGPWAVVTGASDGIGREFATVLGELGMNLVLVARRDERLREVANDLTSRHGIRCAIIAADLSSDVGRRRVEEETCGLDVGLLVAAAGYGTSGDFVQSDVERELDMLQVNCVAALQQCHAFGRRFAARGRGGIVLMSSLLAWQGVPRSANYAATKAYVQSLSEGLRAELGRSGVHVLASAPGPVHSGFARRADMRMSMALPAAVVARATLAALGRRGTVIPGFLSKLLTYSLKPLARPMRTRILAQVMAGMTAHQRASG